ncbi:hypothetical protein BEP19_08015 [Ammoniphilus oxalaticus]|uniref:Phosphoglycolate phosphatase n=1 Tax=Ammoniphilus oxalaticus TaxID=66863 RepID=A0A419SJZ1_9BACL|nr:Cof-type HAD-IIB family hydrolase [Ammoniphilus oxalaticus]RKD24333.1 hypothetical protein BEP19_08015 [Ammoniphilus oxalaticus]
MSQWQLVALDLDGTLLDPAGTISSENRKWIKIAQQSGLEVTIATGRPLRMMKSFLDLLEIRAPYVVANGSEVWAPPNQLLERHLFETKDIEYLLQLAKEYGTHFWSSVVDHVFETGQFPDDAGRYQWLKFGYQSSDQKIMKEIWDRLHARGNLEVSSSDPTNIEVNPYGVTKATGLQTVCDQLGIQAERVVTIGDGLNDISMMRWSGMAIAMENARHQVKAVADRQTVHHAKDGVAAALRALLRD